MLHVPSEWLWPYMISNLVAIALLGMAWRWPLVAKWLFVAMFVGAFCANTSMALRDPADYLNYDQFVQSQIYRDFLNGFFAQHTQVIVLAIAFGQLVIGVLLCGKGWPMRLGVLGAIVFLTAIIPLGVGSAFPFSVFCVAALVLMDWRLRKMHVVESGPKGGAKGALTA